MNEANVPEVLENRGSAPQANMPRLVRLSEIIRDPKLWPREELSNERVQVFTDFFAAGDEEALPPVQLVEDGNGHWLLVDGWHRCGAAENAGREEIAAVTLSVPEGQDVRQFVLLQAIQESSRSAVPLTSEERAQAVRWLLTECPTWSDRAIARLVGVSPSTVGRYRDLQVDEGVQFGRAVPPAGTSDAPAGRQKGRRVRRQGPPRRPNILKVQGGKSPRTRSPKDPQAEVRAAAKALVPQLVRLLMNDRDQRGHIFIGHWLFHFYGQDVREWTNKAADLMVRLQDHVSGTMAESQPENAAPTDEAATSSEARGGRDESFAENAAADGQAAPTPDDEPGHRSSDGGAILAEAAEIYSEMGAWADAIERRAMGAGTAKSSEDRGSEGGTQG